MFRRLALTKVYNQSARLRVFLLSVMLLIVPLFIYFSLHVSGRSKYFKDRNFRQLNNHSRQISERINNLGTAFGNAVEKFVRAGKLEKEDGQPGKDSQQPTVDRKTEFQAYLDILKTDGTYFTATTVDQFAVMKPDADLGLRVSIYLAHAEGTPWLYFDCLGAGNIHFVAKTNFDQLIRRRINKMGDEGLPEEFDHIIIARADNSKTLFDSANDDLTLTSLDSITLADASDKTLDLKTRSKTSDSVDITLAGARYKLYAQPIDIALPTKDSKSEETLWVICGLVEASRFRYQTWSISHTVLIVSAFFAGLLLLSWHFLKLLFIGPKDRLRVAETLILAVSVVIAGSLLTFFFLFGVTYTQLELKLDRQLFTLAQSFQENFKTEVGQAIKQIKSLDSARAYGSGPTDSTSTPFVRDLPNRFGKRNLLHNICADGNCDPVQNPYPYFKMVGWIDDTGQQVSKWSINSQNTRLVRVDTRDYFSKIKDGYYRKLGDEEFWLEPVNSRNTGGFTVVISKAARADRIPKASVVALDTNLMSLTKPAIVAGFSYRIIGPKGDVLLPNIKENFFAECDNDQRLRSAVTGHLSDFVSVPYLGRDVRVYVTPLEGLPDWTLVVFRDKEPLRSTCSEIVALSASLFLIYLLPVLLFIVIVFVVTLITGERMKWMWPSADAAAVYLQFIPVTLLFILMAYLLYSQLSDLGSIVLLSSMSVVALVLFTVTLKRNWAIRPLVNLAGYLERRWPRINHRCLYPLCWVALVFLLAVFPSMTFFRLAYNEEMDLFIKYGQMTLVNSLNAREERVRTTYPTNLFTTEQAAKTFIAARLKEDLDRYYGFFFDTRITENNQRITPREAGHGQVLSQLRKRLPFSQPSSIVRHGLVADASADDLWRWDANDARLTLQVPEASTNAKTFLDIASTPHRYPVNASTLLFFVPTILLVLFLLIRFLLNRVFLLSTIEISNPDAEAPALAHTRNLFLVLNSPFTRLKKLLPVAEPQVLNLKTADGNGEWFKNFDLNGFLQQSRSKPILIESFDYHLDQPHYNLQKLDFLEQLVVHDGGLLVASTAEPKDFLFETTPNNGASDASARWANLMSRFWLVYREDSGDPKEFKTALRAEQQQSQDKNEKRLYGLLIDECSPRACLQDIGREIVQRRNLKTSTADDLISDVLVQAETYYQLIWESCSPGEKLTLAHLAVDGFLSVNDPEVPRLVRRGLITRTREVRLLNESFRLFVLAKSHTDKELAVSEGEARKSSSWQYLKVALSVTVIVLMVFLFATQRDLYNSTLVALTSIAAGVPAVFNFFNLFQKHIGATPARVDS